MIKITFHGHATFSLDIDGTIVVVDPFFAPHNVAATMTVDEVKTADYILITHGHDDHMIDAIPLAQRTGATIIANYEICQWLINQGYKNVSPQHIGGGVTYPFGYLKLTPALHGSAMPDGTYGGMPTGALIKTESGNIYIAGDTGLFSDMSLIGAHDLDVAILPIGDRFTMGPDDSILATNFLQPKVVIPCHYNTWSLIEIDIEKWVKEMQEKTAAIPHILTSEQTYMLP